MIVSGSQKNITLRFRGQLREWQRPLVMGIINVTPDSFFAPSRKSSIDEVVAAAVEMIQEGADILDIGGQSTRPGSVPVSEQEELNRVLPAVKAICSALPEAIISVDTWYARVAEACLDAGASIINDITSGEGDTDMLTVVAKAHVPMVIMHKQGDPQTMQDNPHYTDVVQEVFSYLESRLQAAREAGVHDVIIDPGFGFGKSMEHNLEIVRRFHTLTLLGAPLLAGISRKRMLRTITGADIDDVLPAATAMHMWLLTQGANLLRTHDVKETVQVVKVWEKVKTAYS